MKPHMDDLHISPREGRCPDCQQYGPEHPLGGKFICSRCGWFQEDQATHIIENY